MNLSADILAAVIALLRPEQRSAAAQRLAQLLAGDEVILFLKDPQLDLFLPAPGFPQTLPGGKNWQAFLTRCVASVPLAADLRAPTTGNLTPALGIAEGNQIIVVLGALRADDGLQQVAALLPLLGTALQSEQHAQYAAGQVTLAREAALHATTLAEALEHTRRALQDALQQTEAALQIRDDFLSLAAHELKTPVSAIQGYLQLAQRRFTKNYPLSSRDSRMLETLLEQVQRLTRLIGSLFDLSRIQMGRFSLETHTFDGVELLARIVEDITPSLDRHQVVLTTQRPSMLLDGDSLRLEQVFSNLILNAIKYSPDGGTISVHIDEDNGEMCIHVSDAGIGIPAQAMPQLFTQFYRADNARHQHIPGMGIGLYVVNEIIVAHQGRIAVESVEGHGTTFRISLPITTQTHAQDILPEERGP